MPRSEDRTVRLGLIGCGAIADNYYLPALAREPAVLERLVLVDTDETRRSALARKYGVKGTAGDHRRILGDVDGVIVALPIDLHHPVSLDFLSAGIPVFCEKPLAESGAKAREMAAAARDKGVSLSVNYFQRLIPSFAEAKRLLSEGVLGEPLSIEYAVGEKFGWPTVSGFYFNANSGSRGALRDRGAHIIDHICWWLDGKPELVESLNDSFGGSDTLARVRFRREACSGEVLLSWLSPFPCRFVIRGRDGSVEGNVYDYGSLTVTGASGSKKRIKLKAAGKVGIASRMLSNFLAVIRGTERPLVEGKDVLDSVEFIDECYRRAERFPMPWYDSVRG